MVKVVVGSNFLRRRLKDIFALALLVGLSAFGALLVQTNSFAFLEQKLLDLRFQSFNQQLPVSPSLMYVDIDDQALKSLSQEYGTWPWPRGTVMGKEVTSYILDGAPTAILFDIVYPEYSQKLPTQSIPAEDLAFLNFTSDPSVSHAVRFEEFGSGDGPLLPQATKDSFEIPVIQGPDAPAIPKGHGVLLPYKELAENALSLHTVDDTLDSDGVTRRYTVLVTYQGKYYPSLALRGVIRKLGVQSITLEHQGLTLTLPNKVQRRVPLDKSGRLLINFPGNLDAFDLQGIDKIVASWRNSPANLNLPDKVLLQPAVFKDKLVIIGASAIGLNDVKTMPIGAFGGPFLHMIAANNLLLGQYLFEMPPAFTMLSIGLMLVVMILLTVYLPSTIWRNVLGVVWLGTIIVASLLLFKFQGVVIDMADTIIVGILGLIGSVVFLSLTEGAEKRFIRSAFSTYLSPLVIKQMESDPSKLNLGGEKRLMTAMFTDVKGFSTFSEKLDPNDLVHLLNEYLTVMSDIILDSNGTIDKYEGDAIIAFWGAPLDQADHATLALKSAIHMRKAEAELNPRLMAAGLASSPLFTRIGINSGDMTVGNMGTPRRMNYTIMGNTVNLAARLEGVNKVYGTWILTTQTTKNLVGGDFTLRGLDMVEVIGIKEPQRLYEVFDEKTATDPTIQTAFDCFQEGIAAYETQQWQAAIKAFQETLRQKPQDGPAQVFIKRCQELKANPPAENWNGVYTMTSK